MTTKQYLKRAQSKAAVKGFNFNTTSGTVFPDFSFAAVISAINNDPVARGAVNHFIDKCMEGVLSFVKRDDLSYDPKLELRLQEKYNFRTEILRKTFVMAKLYNNVFIENVKDTDNNVKALNVLDSSNVEPITEANGDVISYKTKAPHPTTGDYISWDKGEITWVKFGDRTEGYAPVDMRALWENLKIKEYVKRYVGWLWQTGQYRVLYNFKNSSDQDIENWLAFNKKHDDDFKKPSILKGELETKLLRDMREQESLIQFLEYLDGQTLILLRVPPIDAGIPDASGRSSSDSQKSSFDTSIIGLKKVVEDYINFDLFPKINKGKSLMKFGPTDRFAERQVWENLQIMQSMNMTDDVMQEYLQDRGLFYSSKLFKKAEETQTLINPRSKDTAPSRQGKSEGASNAKIGTGEQSTTREDQL
jgi:hypothetical protein